MDELKKKPDLMALKKYAEKTFEIAYVECSRVVCAKSKKTDDSMKLWRKHWTAWPMLTNRVDQKVTNSVLWGSKLRVRLYI